MKERLIVPTHLAQPSNNNLWELKCTGRQYMQTISLASFYIRMLLKQQAFGGEVSSPDSGWNIVLSLKKWHLCLAKFHLFTRPYFGRHECEPRVLRSSYQHRRLELGSLPLARKRCSHNSTTIKKAPVICGLQSEA